MQNALFSKRPFRKERTMSWCSLLSYDSSRTQTNFREASMNSFCENKLFCVAV